MADSVHHLLPWLLHTTLKINLHAKKLNGHGKRELQPRVNATLHMTASQNTRQNSLSSCSHNMDKKEEGRLAAELDDVYSRTQAQIEALMADGALSRDKRARAKAWLGAMRQPVCVLCVCVGRAQCVCVCVCH